MTLGQIEAFVPPPTRRLIVGRYATGWCGVDPSTKRCAIATISAEGERRVDVVSFPALEGAARMAAIYDGVLELYSYMNRHVGVVVVEQPSGKQPNPQLSYAVGATLAAIGAADSLSRPHVEMVTSSAWKRVACGDGGIRKPKPTEQREYGVLQWARTVGYEGGSWDAADAMAICEYARRTFSLDAR